MLENVLKVVGAEFGISRAQLLSATRSSPDAAWARQVAMWLYFQAGAPCNYSLVGREFNRDRTTVRHAVAKANRLLSDQDADRLVTNVRAIASV